jgi:hypothetical protein
MTKVILTESVLTYRREMAEAVSQTIKAGFIEGVKVWRPEFGDPPLGEQNLLSPPKLDIEPTMYQGQVDDPIFFMTFTDFDVWSLHVFILDETGKMIESGDAFQFEDCSIYWDYRATVPVPPSRGKRVSVYAVATDQLGGVGATRMVVMVP